MRHCWLAAAAVFMLLAPFAGAIQEPTVEFIPSQISINSSFLMIADPHATAVESVNVQWIIFGTSGFGSFPKAGGKWICYFSNMDPESTCGPSVFPSPSYGVPYEIQVNATNQFGSTESTMANVNVGGVRMTNQITVDGSNVYISAWASGAIVGGVSYKVYNAETIEEVPGKSGTIPYNPNIAGFNTTISLPNGDYYIAFTANTTDDFTGGVSRVTIGSGGGGIGSPDIKADDIVYSPVIYPGQELSIKDTFKITNTGSDNLSGISVTVPPGLLSYLSISPQQSNLGPNETAYMSVTIRNILYSTNITTYAILTTGSKELRIPVDLRVTVIGQPPESTCSGKADKSLCTGGMCCDQICRPAADCCSSSDCLSGQACSGYKCAATNECADKTDKSICAGGICCSKTCITGGECCSETDCSSGETCNYDYKCEGEANECSSKSDGESCAGGVCCSHACIPGGECCSESDCLSSLNETCVSNKCESPTTPEGGLDIITIALIGGGVAAAGFAGFFFFKKFKGKTGGKKKKEGEEEGEEEEFSEEDFY